MRRTQAWSVGFTAHLLGSPCRCKIQQSSTLGLGPGHQLKPGRAQQRAVPQGAGDLVLRLYSAVCQCHLAQLGDITVKASSCGCSCRGQPALPAPATATVTTAAENAMQLQPPSAKSSSGRDKPGLDTCGPGAVLRNYHLFPPVQGAVLRNCLTRPQHNLTYFRVATPSRPALPHVPPAFVCPSCCCTKL